MTSGPTADVFLPIPASQEERGRALAGAWVHPEGRLVLRVKVAGRDPDPALDALWRGDADGFPPLVVGAADTEARIFRFLYAFEPAELEDEVPMAGWHLLLDKYGGGGLEEDLRREDFTELFLSAFTCTRGDRFNEGIVLQYETGMVRLCNELRRRILA
jgi:hypothetical protein